MEEPRRLIGERGGIPKEAVEMILGWSNTVGVWFLWVEDEGKLPKDPGRLHMALNMKERCGIVEEYGGTSHSDPKDVPQLR